MVFLLLRENPTPLDLSNQITFFLLCNMSILLDQVHAWFDLVHQDVIKGPVSGMFLFYSVDVILKLSSSHACKKFHFSFSFSNSSLNKSRVAAFSKASSTLLLLHHWLDLRVCPYLSH